LNFAAAPSKSQPFSKTPFTEEWLGNSCASLLQTPPFVFFVLVGGSQSRGNGIRCDRLIVRTSLTDGFLQIRLRL